MKFGKHSMLGAALWACIAGAPASAGCWNDTELAAAHVRQLQTMLMVATLKCNAAGIDISSAYNGFVKARLPALNAANGEIRRHFDSAGGQDQYDRFSTSLANGHSSDATNAASCGAAAQLAMDASAQSADLVLIGSQRITERALPEGACAAPAMATSSEAPAAAPVTLASAAPVAAPSPALAATASQPPLPADVVAAMAVLAAYARDHGVAAPAPAAGVAIAQASITP